ncbi:MAG: glycosyltransferase family 4 protein [Clostridia bacterium]|nr:glycosyltransferase family 4 protein [Clostridia bacterium]
MSKIFIATNHSYMLYRFRKELIAELLKDNSVTLSMPFVGHEKDFEAMGCKCINTEIDRRGINPKNDLKLLLTYFRQIKSEKPDKIITYSIKPNIYCGFVASLFRIPYFINVQGLGTAFQSKKLAPVVTAMYKAATRKAKTVFFENTANAQEFIDRKILKKEQITVLNGAGINLDTFKFYEYPDDSVIKFLYLGRIMKEKGIDELFDAFSKLKNEFGDKVSLDIVGFFEDEYKEIIDSLSEKKIINFHGFQTDTIPYYHNCSCVVLPSYHEGLSNVLLEASATGRPVITSDIPGCKETVDNKKTGYLVNVKDSDDLYDKMKKFVLLSAEEKSIMGKNARTKMENEFDKKQVVKNTIDKII